MRKPRVLVPGAIYHVTNRINNSNMILKHDDIKQLFYTVLKKAKQKYNFYILQLCIMGNHVHILIKPNSDEPYELSKICQWIFSCFARIYNNIHRTSGHVWGDRFHSMIIKTKTHLKNVCRYINENPVRAKIVHNPLDFRFNTVSIVIKRITINQDWDIFDDIPRLWKKIILSLIGNYKSNKKLFKITKGIQNNKKINPIDSKLSFYSTRQKWCKNGSINIDEKLQYGKKFDEYSREIAKENLKCYLNSNSSD